KEPALAGRSLERAGGDGNSRFSLDLNLAFDDRDQARRSSGRRRVWRRAAGVGNGGKAVQARQHRSALECLELNAWATPCTPRTSGGSFHVARTPIPDVHLWGTGEARG